MGLQSSVPCWVVGRMTDKLPFGGEVVRLGDVCEVVGGATPKTGNTNYWNGSIRWITPAELNNESHVVTDTAKHLTMDGFHSASLRMMPAGTVLLTTRAPIGKVAIAGAEMCCNQGFKNLICSNKVYNEYLYRYLKFHAAELQSLGSGATFKELSKRTVSNLQIYLPALDFQHEAIQKLSEVDRAIGYTNDLTSTLSDLVKSRFVEMFGDPIDTNSTWPRKPIKDFCELRIGPFGSSLHRRDYVEGGHALINPSHIVNGAIAPDMSLTISDERYSEMDPYHLEIGDVVLGRRGEIGRCAVVCEPGLLCGTGSMIVRPKAGCRPDYLQRVISFPTFKDALEANAVGQTMKNLNAKIVGNAVVALPPIKVQDEFASFAEHIDKLRFEQLLALKKRGSQYLIAP